MSDFHINQVARRLQRALDQHATDRAAEPASARRRQQLRRVADRARARVAEAEARRATHYTARPC
jgi:hypothetical protein